MGFVHRTGSLIPRHQRRRVCPGSIWDVLWKVTPACSAGSCPRPGPFWARCCRVERALPTSRLRVGASAARGNQQAARCQLAWSNPLPSPVVPKATCDLGFFPSPGGPELRLLPVGWGFGGRLFNWTPSLLTKEKSQEPRGGGGRPEGLFRILVPPRNS